MVAYLSKTNLIVTIIILHIRIFDLQLIITKKMKTFKDASFPKTNKII